ncbi:hypothetical protein LPJ57_009032 [Coemansia sp. RSA 486]|nr:hypothetical protein LPJ57_009032 [Coemansia sp. RSA 486]
MRSVLPDHSAASVLPFAPVKETKANSSKADTRSNTYKDDTAAHRSACGWHPAKFNHAMVLVVDALRINISMGSNKLSASELPQNASSRSEQTMVACRLKGGV